MHVIFWIAVIFSLVTIGFVTGYNTAYTIQQENQGASVTGVLVIVASSVGAIISSLGLLQTWNKERIDTNKELAKEKREKLATHYLKDIREPVLNEWLKMYHYAGYKVAGLADSDIALYSVFHYVMAEKDRFHEAMAHLSSGYGQHKIMEIYREIKTAEEQHNNDVSNFLTSLTETIAKDIALHTRLRPREGRVGEVDYYEFRYLAEFLYKVASHQLQIASEPLEVKASGDRFTLTHRNIGMLAFGISEADLVWLKNHLEAQHQGTIKQIQEFLSTLKEISELCVQFRSELEIITHEADRLGIEGRCPFEERLSKQK